MHCTKRILSGGGLRAASWAGVVALLFSVVGAQGVQAQSPNAAASGGAKSDEGFYPGWNLGTRFEGSTSGDGSVYNLGFGGGYKFSHHFGGSLGIPFYFLRPTNAGQAKNPPAGFGAGLGNSRWGPNV